MLESLLFKQTKNITVGHEDVEKSTFLDTVGGNVNWQSYYGKYYRDESKY